jgi:hypothetical protein
MSVRTRVLVLLLLIATLPACRDARPASPIAPAQAPPVPAPVPAPTGSSWTGTFSSSNWAFSPFGISTRLAVYGTDVVGGWNDLPWWDFGGSITGTLDGTSFSGTVTINGCKAEFSGTLTDVRADWTSPGLSGECAPLYPGLPHPAEMRIQLSR